MTLPILIAAILTWLALVAILHVAIFVTISIGRARGMSVKSMKGTALFCALLCAGAAILFPVLYPLVLFRSARRFLSAIRLAMHLLDVKPTEIDMTVLPKEEQLAFLQRLHSDDDHFAIMHEVAARVREVEQ